MARKAVRVRISGGVQGVGFRAFVQRRAIALDVVGWVRNRADHSVEALFVGTREAVDALCDACRRGPPGARVDHFEATPELAPDDAHGFTILPTG